MLQRRLVPDANVAFDSHYPYASAPMPMYSARDGLLTSALVHAAGGPNLLGGTPYGNAHDWDMSPRNPPTWENPEDEEINTTAHLTNYVQSRVNWEKNTALSLGIEKAYTGLRWTSGQVLLNPYWRGEGDFSINPQPQLRIDYFRV